MRHDRHYLLKTGNAPFSLKDMANKSHRQTLDDGNFPDRVKILVFMDTKTI